MAYATTKQARDVMRDAARKHGGFMYGSWTDKVSKKDTKRRGIAIGIGYQCSEDVLETLRAELTKKGFGDSARTVKLTESEAGMFLRCIAYME